MSTPAVKDRHSASPDRRHERRREQSTDYAGVAVHRHDDRCDGHELPRVRVLVRKGNADGITRQGAGTPGTEHERRMPVCAEQYGAPDDKGSKATLLISRASIAYNGCCHQLRDS
ncbi:MAG: hypothetical protein MK142_05755, partial [Pseudomonadales bacterium]|nr:hypothetical protein [Pseudomonadales bacterium]